MKTAILQPDDVLSYWLDEVGADRWYRGDQALDDAIRARFLTTWEDCQEGGCGLWLTDPAGVLAYVILTDQFSRNMFRGDPRSFATDAQARVAAKLAMDHDWDLQIDEPARHFFYMPLMHSENLVDQDKAVELIGSRLPQTGAGQLDHAIVHRDIVREFGRFPFRNTALARDTTSKERVFLEEGGYGIAYRTYQGLAK